MVSWRLRLCWVWKAMKMRWVSKRCTYEDPAWILGYCGHLKRGSHLQQPHHWEATVRLGAASSQSMARQPQQLSYSFKWYCPHGLVPTDQLSVIAFIADHDGTVSGSATAQKEMEKKDHKYFINHHCFSLLHSTWSYEQVCDYIDGLDAYLQL